MKLTCSRVSFAQLDQFDKITSIVSKFLFQALVKVTYLTKVAQLAL